MIVACGSPKLLAVDLLVVALALLASTLRAGWIRLSWARGLPPELRYAGRALRGALGVCSLTWAVWVWGLYEYRFLLAVLLGDTLFAQSWITAGLASLLQPQLNRWILSRMDPIHGPGLLFLSLCAAAASALFFAALGQIDGLSVLLYVRAFPHP